MISSSSLSIPISAESCEASRRTGRKIKNILLRKNKSILVKQVNYINNKLLIHQNNDFDIIVCKCNKDAKRLYDTLFEFYNTNKLKNIMFTGKVYKNKKQVYKIIKELDIVIVL